ncbi:MAG: hypothetical protein WA324_02780 [Bryobacteraceae bacterium]
MEIVDRYLQAVLFWLPEEQRADITAELREDIHSEIEERELELGRSLTKSDVEALLKRRGNPLLIAQRYLPQRFLIGPRLFPIYCLVLKIALPAFALPTLVVWLSALLFSPTLWVGRAVIENLHPLGLVWTVLCGLFLAITVVFALLERLQERAGLLDHWSPEKLKPVQDFRQVPRSQSGSELAAALVFMAWWRGWVDIPNVPGIQLTYGPIWHPLYWPIVVAVFLFGLIAAVQLIRPVWTRAQSAARLVVDVAAVTLAGGLIVFHPWVSIIAPALAPNAIAGIEDSINGALAVVLVFAVVSYVLRATQDLRRLRGEEPLHHWTIRTLAGS